MLTNEITDKNHQAAHNKALQWNFKLISISNKWQTRNFLTSLWVWHEPDVFKHSVSRYLPLVIPFADFLWPQRLACRKEIDKHKNKKITVDKVLKWDCKTWSSQAYYTMRDFPPKLSFTKSHSPETTNQSLSSKSQVSHAVRAAPFQPKLPLLLVLSLLLSPLSLPSIPLSFLLTCQGNLSTAQDTPPKSTWSPIQAFGFLCAV